MTAPDEAVPWLTDRRVSWLAEVASWIAERLGVDMDVDALETVKQRPWGAVLRVRATASGVTFFKAVGPQGRHETTLLADLAASGTHLAPAVIAVDLERGWLLMLDHGKEISRETLDLQVSVIETLLPEYAELQRTTSDRTDRWIAAGVTDRTPRRLPPLLDELLAGKGRSGPLPVEAEEIARFAELLDVFAEVCDVLADGPVPMAIDHADIHGTNVLLGNSRPRLIDWGDSCIGHPFSSLLVPVEWVAGRLDRHDRAHATERLAAAYLEPWGSAADRGTLGTRFGLATSPAPSATTSNPVVAHQRMQRTLSARSSHCFARGSESTP
ncbi:MAG: phosphotransferase family protein [Acidimicrobiia bacterium]